MAVRDWHPGQLAVLWIAGGVAEFFMFVFLSDTNSEAVRKALIYPFLVLPFVILGVTWVWFGSRPKR